MGASNPFSRQPGGQMPPPGMAPPMGGSPFGQQTGIQFPPPAAAGGSFPGAGATPLQPSQFGAPQSMAPMPPGGMFANAGSAQPQAFGMPPGGAAPMQPSQFGAPRPMAPMPPGGLFGAAQQPAPQQASLPNLARGLMMQPGMGPQR